MARAYPMIDGLRGFGALSIASYHTFRYGPLPEAAREILPDFITRVFDSGWMAVQWFFVIAGWSAVMSSQGRAPGLAEFPKRMGKRILRLGPAYWIAVLLAAFLTILAIGVADDHSLNQSMPSWHQLVAHLCFLQDILGYDCLTTGIWFVAIALQLEAVFLILLGLSMACERDREKQYPRPIWLLLFFSPPALWSLFISAHITEHDIWFIKFFSLYTIGILLGWKIAHRVPAVIFWVFVGLVTAVGCWLEVLEMLIASLAGVVLYVADATGQLENKLRHPLPQFLGRISYCLFVIHYPIVWLVTRGGELLTGTQPFPAVCWLGCGILASILAATGLQKFIDRFLIPAKC
ncbi:MAG: acyltransferase family protein [Planctomycetota bacterium]